LQGPSAISPRFCPNAWTIVDADNPVRAVDAFIDALYLSELGFTGVEPAATGRPGNHDEGFARVPSSTKLKLRLMRTIWAVLLGNALTT
jgi:hypothetical protein